MRILYLCHRFPYPPKRGGKIRPFNMIRHLAASHQVSVVSLVRSEREEQEANGIAPFCTDYYMARINGFAQTARMVARLPTTVPSSFGFFYSASMAGSVRKLLAEQKFDLIFVHCSSVARYVEHVRDVAKILDFGDMDSQKWLDYSRYRALPLNAGYWLEGRKLQAEERRLAKRFDFCTTTTQAELETLRGYGVSTPTDWFPNGVDSEYFAPAAEGYDADTICFVGRMDYYPNQECMLEFCAQTLPLLREARLSVKLLIVGAEPSPAIRRLAEPGRVVVTGSVPDVRPYVRGSALMVAPLNIARGTQNKLLEAMALGVPVVTSKIAAAGIDAKANEHVYVAETPTGYRDAILRILSDPRERQRLSQAGRARMLTHHNWVNSMKRMDDMIRRCLDASPFQQANRQVAI